MLTDIAVTAALAALSCLFAFMEAAAAKGGKDSKATNKTLTSLKTVAYFAMLYAAVYAAQSFNAPAAAIVLLLSLVFLIFCGKLPGRFAKMHSQAANRVLGPLIAAVSFILTPVSIVINAAANALSKLIGIGDAGADADITEEEIRMMVIAGGETGTIEATEKEMITNVFEFNNTSVDEICTHRKDIFALPITSSINEIIRAAALERYTRIPVYSENIDNIEGILHIKDIFNIVMEQNNERDDFDLRQIIHKPYFVPLSKTTDRLFHEMKKNKIHIAIVVDEYGGTSGLVTMEDLIEEIMGSIQDEYDEEEKQEIIPISTNTYEVSGTTELETVAEFFESPLPVGDYETLGGFLISQLGRVPADGEQPEIEYENLLFKIHKIEDRRISVVIVCKL